MYLTMTQIGKSYGVDAKTVGKILYDLKIRDANHPEQKGFPHEQAVTHGMSHIIGSVLPLYNLRLFCGISDPLPSLKFDLKTILSFALNSFSEFL